MISDDLLQKITDLWKNSAGKTRYDKPVLQVVFDGDGEPKFVTEAMLSGGGSTVATTDNVVMQDTDGTLFFKRISSDTPPVLTNYKLSDGTAYTITGTPTPYGVATVGINGAVEITNDSGSKIPIIDDVLTTAQTLTGYLAVAENQVIADYKQLDAKDITLFAEILSGAGSSSTYDAAHGGVAMTVTNSGDYVIRQSKASHNYTSGNPISVRLTTRQLQPVAGRIKRLGYFSSNTVAPYDVLDGWCVETDPNGTDVWLRIYKSGAVTYEKKQAEWDSVALRTADLSLFEAVEIDALYLGGTATQFKFLMGDKVVIAHSFLNSGVGSSTYVGSPNQFIRYEIRATTTAAATSFYHICSVVGSMGSGLPAGVTRRYSLRETFVNANTGGTGYLLVAIRPNTKNAQLSIVGFDCLAETADKFELQLLLNPTIAGLLSWTAQTGLSCDIAYGDVVGNPSANTVGGGVLIDGAYGAGVNSLASLTKTIERLGRKLVGSYDVMALVVVPTGVGAVNLDIHGGIKVEHYL